MKAVKQLPNTQKAMSESEAKGIYKRYRRNLSASIDLTVGSNGPRNLASWSKELKRVTNITKNVAIGTVAFSYSKSKYTWVGWAESAAPRQGLFVHCVSGRRRCEPTYDASGWLVGEHVAIRLIQAARARTDEEVAQALRHLGFYLYGLMLLSLSRSKDASWTLRTKQYLVAKEGLFALDGGLDDGNGLTAAVKTFIPRVSWGARLQKRFSRWDELCSSNGFVLLHEGRDQPILCMSPSPISGDLTRTYSNADFQFNSRILQQSGTRSV